MPIRSFADQPTADIWNGLDTKDARTLPKEIWESAYRKLVILNTATSLLTLGKINSLGFESLKANRPGFYSIRVNLRYRILFMWKDGNAYVVSIENYHGRTTS